MGGRARYGRKRKTMSGVTRLWTEIKALERDGLVVITGTNLTVISGNEDRFRDRILNTGPQGALFLLGLLDDFLDETHQPLSTKGDDSEKR